MAVHLGLRRVSAERSCERWLGGWPSPHSSIEHRARAPDVASVCPPATIAGSQDAGSCQDGV
eukprot:6052762-Prymnesium_polylepis.1